MKRRCIRYMTIILLCSGLIIFSRGIYIFAKARLAQMLLKRAWSETIEERRNTKPWSWADTYPVARLIVPQIDEDYIVLEGCSGSSLAFGPGHMIRTPMPGEEGNCVISGHRDTHFSFLQNLKRGDALLFETSSGEIYSYRVIKALVLNKSDTWILNKTTERRITLITCYPFNSIMPGGDLRYAVLLTNDDSKIAINMR